MVGNMTFSKDTYLREKAERVVQMNAGPYTHDSKVYNSTTMLNEVWDTSERYNKAVYPWIAVTSALVGSIFSGLIYLGFG